MYYLYILKSLNKTNELYVGSTNDLKVRFNAHNSGKVVSTKRYRPWQIVYYEAYLFEKFARLREQKLKHHGNAMKELKKRTGITGQNIEVGGLPSTTFNRIKSGAGFTIIELLITVAIFGILLAGVLGAFAAASRSAKAAREKTLLASLALDYMEIVRNMPYSQIGTLFGNPSGQLPECPLSERPSCPNAFSKVIETSTYKIFYDVVYVDDPSDGLATDPTPDLAPADYKQVKMSILKLEGGQVTDFVTSVAPQGASGSVNLGSLSIAVVNAQGQPVAGANIHIQYPTTSPFTLNVDRTSDSNGNWEEAGLAPAVNKYRIVVSKPGYSTDQTYPITVSNPNPTKPDATVVNSQVTRLVFSIDLLSNLTINTVDEFCNALNGVGVNVVGAKLIGTSPNVPKFSGLFYSGPAAYPNGQILLNNIEWDTYTPSLAAGPYTLIGTSPIQKIDVLPNTSQIFTMYLRLGSGGNTLLVIVKDSATGAPLEGATIHLQKGGSNPQDYYGSSGGSVWLQRDWSGGGGYADWNPALPNTYDQTTGNIFVNNSNGSNDVELGKVGNSYVVDATSTLESSTFDTVAGSTGYTTLNWLPASQDPATFLGLQLASNNDKAAWNYIGPDGTANSYYQTPGSSINSAHNGNRYLRYKLFLRTHDDKKTPVLSSLQINYVTSCIAPGQAFFMNLTPSSGNAYTITVTLPGYQTVTIPGIDIGNNNPPLEILMSPE